MVEVLEVVEDGKTRIKVAGAVVDLIIRADGRSQTMTSKGHDREERKRNVKGKEEGKRGKAGNYDQSFR